MVSTQGAKGIGAEYAQAMRDGQAPLLDEDAFVGSAGWNNPSVLGHPCLRFLVLRRTKGNVQRPPSRELLARRYMGKEVQKIAMRRLMEMGWEIQAIEGPVEWPKYQIRGRPDVKARPPGSGRRPFLPIEIKSVHPNLMAGVRTLEDMLHNRYWRVRTWPSQLISYELLEGYEEGIFLPISLTGVWEPFDVPLDYEHAEALLRQCEAVNAHIEAGTEPQAIADPDVCPGCPFFQTAACDITLAFAPDMGVVTDEDAISDIRRMLEIKPQRDEYEALNKRLKTLFQGPDHAQKGDEVHWVVPDVALVRSRFQEVQVGPQEPRVNRFWRTDYTPLAPEEGDDADT